MLREFCHRSKNLYNHGNFLIRQTFIDDGKWLRYGEVDRLLKADIEYPDYREMPTAQTAQQTLRILDKNWTSFFAAIKDWKAHPEKYKGRPKLPKYKPKDGYFPLVLTNQNCKLKDGIIRFPRTFQGFTVKAVFVSQPDAIFKQARIILHGGEICIELVYEISEVEEKADNGKYAAIDIGVDNLAALAWNTGKRPVLFKGTPLKSVNQYYNKQMAKRRSICERMNGRHSSKRIGKRWPTHQCRCQWCLPDHAKSIPECERRRDRGRSVAPSCSNSFDERSPRLRLCLMRERVNSEIY